MADVDLASVISAEIAQLRESDPDLRAAALASLSDIAADAYGHDAAMLGKCMRDSGSIELLVACLDEPSHEVKQCTLSILGNLLTDVFDPEAASSLRLFVAAGGLVCLQDMLTEPYPLTLYAAAALQNVTALDPGDVCTKLRQQRVGENAQGPGERRG